MVTLTIIANEAPYWSEKTWNALRLAGASVTAETGMKVNVFLMGDSVAAAKKGQVTPEGYYNTEKMITDLVARESRFSAVERALRREVSRMPSSSREPRETP